MAPGHPLATDAPEGPLAGLESGVKTTTIIAGLLAAASAFGAIPAHAGDTTVQVTPWLRLEEHSPLIDVPHSFVSSAYHARVIIRVGSEWKPVFEATSNLGVPQLNPIAFNQGHSVFFDATVGAEGPFLLSEGAPTPILFKSDRCRRVYVRIDAGTLLCLHGEYAPADSSRYARMRMEVIGPSGKSLEVASATLPPALAEPLTRGTNSPLAWSPAGNPILQASDDKARECIAIELRTPTAREVLRLPGPCPTPNLWYTAVAQAPVSPSLPAPKVEGRWRIEGASGEGEWRLWPYPGCIRVDEYRADGTFSTWSGKQEMRGCYRIEPNSGGFMLVRSEPRFLGEADCSGVTPEAAAREHFFPKLGIERDGDRLHLHIPFVASRLEFVPDKR